MVMGVVIGLEGGVMGDDPGAFLAHEGPQDGGCIFVVIIRRQRVADIMQKRRDDPVGIGAVVQRARRRLQAMGQPADLVAGHGLVFLRRQRGEEPIGRAVDEGLLELGEKLVVFPGAVLHLGEGYGAALIRHRDRRPVKCLAESWTFRLAPATRPVNPFCRARCPAPRHSRRDRRGWLRGARAACRSTPPARCRRARAPAVPPHPDRSHRA